MEQSIDLLNILLSSRNSLLSIVACFGHMILLHFFDKWHCFVSITTTVITTLYYNEFVINIIVKSEWNIVYKNDNAATLE